MSENPPSKTQLRSELRQRRQRLTATEQRAAARAVAHRIGGLPQWSTARRIALYRAADGEIDTDPLVELARADNKLLFLPVVRADDNLAFAAWLAGEHLSPNRYGIPEPPAAARRCPAAELDILFLPLVGWDRRGGRLGMGAGFYDRTLSGIQRPLLIGLAHACQEVGEIPMDEWDIGLDFIATDNALYRCQGSR